MRLHEIYRYPVKGLSPERLERSELVQDLGLPYDRVAGFTSGRRAALPRQGGWAPSNTFLQLASYPGLARFETAFDEATRSIAVTAPDGMTAVAALGEPATFAAANDLIRRHFAPGPYGTPELHEQTGGRGHWDFTDTGLSLCNLATVRQIEAVAGRPIDPLRFRANLYLDGLEPWQEFGLIGHGVRIGEADIEVLRPVMRCGATSVDPNSAEVDVDVPKLLHGSVGHTCLAVYARVVKGGAIARSDAVVDLGASDVNPAVNVPPGTPNPRKWPRLIELQASGSASLKFISTHPGWPLPDAQPGATLRLHPGSGGVASPVTVRLLEARTGCYIVERSSALAGVEDGSRLILTGPYGSDRHQ